MTWQNLSEKTEKQIKSTGMVEEIYRKSVKMLQI